MCGNILQHVTFAKEPMMVANLSSQQLPFTQSKLLLKCGTWYVCMLNMYFKTDGLITIPSLCIKLYNLSVSNGLLYFYTCTSIQVGIDLIGPLPETPRGYKYIVTLVDYLSKWPEAEPLPNRSAKRVALFLYRMMCR